MPRPRFLSFDFDFDCLACVSTLKVLIVTLFYRTATHTHRNDTFVSTMILPREVRVGGVEVDISSFDFSDHSSNVPSVKTANAILIVLVSCFVGLRVFVRLFIVRKIFLDDSEFARLSGGQQPLTFPTVLILAAAVFTITLAAVCIAGRGNHVQRTHGIHQHVQLQTMGWEPTCGCSPRRMPLTLQRAASR